MPNFSIWILGCRNRISNLLRHSRSASQRKMQNIFYLLCFFTYTLKGLAFCRTRSTYKILKTTKFPSYKVHKLTMISWKVVSSLKNSNFWPLCQNSKIYSLARTKYRYKLSIKILIFILVQWIGIYLFLSM